MTFARTNKSDYTDRRYRPSITKGEFVFPEVEALIYTGLNAKGKAWAMGYHGKAGKADFYIQFQTYERCAEYIANYLLNLKAHQDRRANERAERKNFKHGLRVGMMLHGSWGYDQTNCEYYKVTKVLGKHVEIVEIGHKTVEGSEGFMSEMVNPDPDKVIGEPIKKLVLPGNRLSFDHFSLSLCGNDSKYYSSHYA